ncbi:MAG: hypothetical protein O2968_09255 [Acidobacteria bacterium]|nr:hypothetical protein [Acidobacteriota bacterium]
MRRRQAGGEADQGLELARGVVEAILLASLDTALRMGSRFGRELGLRKKGCGLQKQDERRAS